MSEQPSRGRIAVAVLIVLLLVIAVAKFIDYRMRPPPPALRATNERRFSPQSSP